MEDYVAISRPIPCYHYLATCTDCKWEDAAAGNHDIDRCRREVVKHVEQNGHTVSVEKGSGIIYEPH